MLRYFSFLNVFIIMFKNENFTQSIRRNTVSIALRFTFEFHCGQKNSMTFKFDENNKKKTFINLVILF